MPGGLQAIDTIAVQLEAVSPELPLTVEKEYSLDARIQDKGKSDMVSTRNYRIPMQTALPGAVSAVSLDGGDFPDGGEPQFDNGTITPLAYCVPLRFTELAKLTGSGGDVSTVDVIARSIAQCQDTLRLNRDKFLQTDGTGKLGTVKSTYGGAGANPITVESTPFGSALVAKGQKVAVYNGNALRNTFAIMDLVNGLGSSYSLSADAVPAGTVAGDFIRVDGLANGAPVFLNGIPYFVSTSTAGSVEGIARSNQYVVAQGVNAGSSSLTFPMFRLLKNQIEQKLGPDALSGMVIHTHGSQIAAYEELGFALQTMPLNDGQGGAFDPFLKPKTMDGHEIIRNIHADRTRLDLLNLDVWGKVKWGKGTFWYEVEGLGRMFPIPSSTGGGWSSGVICYLVDCIQFYVSNLTCQGAITSMAVPTGG